MKDAEAMALLEKIMDRMVKAGWLLQYTFTEGKGFHLAWAPDAVVKVGTLRKLVATYRLTSSESMVVAFTKLAQGVSLADAGLAGPRPAKDVLTYWKEAVDELAVDTDADLLVGFAAIIHGWAPDLSDVMKKDREN